MTKRTTAKYKLDRRMGENLWGRPKSPVNKRDYGPGQHGQRRKSKLSDYRPSVEGQAEAQGDITAILPRSSSAGSSRKPNARRGTQAKT